MRGAFGVVVVVATLSCSTFEEAPAPPAVDPDAGAAACAWDAPWGEPVALGINTPEEEATARLTADELVVYYERGPNVLAVELWTAMRASRDQPFTRPVKIEELASGTLTAMASPSGNGNALYFARLVTAAGLDLFVARRRAGDSFFAAPSPVPVTNTPDHEVNPYALPDESALYFGRSSAGLTSIHKLALPGGQPAPVPGIELPGLVIDAPVVSPDERTIWFSGRTPPGKNDVYVAHREKTSDAFGAPARVTELATDVTDTPSWISPDLCRMYLTSDRLGSFDLFVVERRR